MLFLLYKLMPSSLSLQTHSFSGIWGFEARDTNVQILFLVSFQWGDLRGVIYIS